MPQLQSRIGRLERARKTVIRGSQGGRIVMSDSGAPLPEAVSRIRGPVVLLPRQCETLEEWVAQCI